MEPTRSGPWASAVLHPHAGSPSAGLQARGRLLTRPSTPPTPPGKQLGIQLFAFGGPRKPENKHPESVKLLPPLSPHIPRAREPTGVHSRTHSPGLGERGAQESSWVAVPVPPWSSFGSPADGLKR